MRIGAVICQCRLRGSFTQIRRPIDRARHREEPVPAVSIRRHICGHRVELRQAGQINPRQLPRLREGVLGSPGRRCPAIRGFQQIGEFIRRLIENAARSIGENRPKSGVLTINRAQRRCDQDEAVVSVVVAEEAEIIQRNHPSEYDRQSWRQQCPNIAGLNLLPCLRQAQALRVPPTEARIPLTAQSPRAPADGQATAR
jgi:hypothetical protein